MGTMKTALEAAGFWTLPAKRRPWHDGKFPHDTMGQAQAAVRSLQRRDLAKDCETIHAYQCVTCLKFHTGHYRRDQCGNVLDAEHRNPIRRSEVGAVSKPDGSGRNARIANPKDKRRPG